MKRERLETLLIVGFLIACLLCCAVLVHRNHAQAPAPHLVVKTEIARVAPAKETATVPAPSPAKTQTEVAPQRTQSAQSEVVAPPAPAPIIETKLDKAVATNEEIVIDEEEQETPPVEISGVPEVTPQLLALSSSPSAPCSALPAPRLFLLTADWCAPCKRLEREILPGLTDLKIEILDVDRSPDAVKPLWSPKSRALPQLVLKAGEKPVQWLIGYRSEAEIRKFAKSRTAEEKIAPQRTQRTQSGDGAPVKSRPGACAAVQKTHPATKRVLHWPRQASAQSR